MTHQAWLEGTAASLLEFDGLDITYIQLLLDLCQIICTMVMAASQNMNDNHDNPT